MRILSLNTEPIHEFSYLNAGHGPGGFEEVRLPLLEGWEYQRGMRLPHRCTASSGESPE